ncbi:hypothetical protein L1049_003978 [Liquidambar formosana]|uniref:Uncharacterized protein n=1 Tax=Liquidambar formosana TaxID=63359 RepID=A0AAP0RNK5_LIQFO
MLRSLILSSNMLLNDISSTLGKLGMLEVLDLSRNFLSGLIPPVLGNCRQLKLLVLKNNFGPLLSKNDSALTLQEEEEEEEEDFNSFDGELPSSIVKLPNLRVLWAPNSNLEGIFPQDWGSCSNLELLNLAQNYFTGQVSASLGNCKSLYFLDISSNNLTGLFPEKVSVPCMIVFNISGNSFSGDVPNFSHSECTKMFANQSLSHMDLLGFYPSFFYLNALASIGTLFLPSDRLAVLHDFSNNMFVGPLPPIQIAPSRFYGMPSYGFWFHGNNLEGNISSYSFDPYLSFDSLIFDIGNNKITGELPSELGGCCKCIKLLNLAGNEIVGSMVQFLLSFAYLGSLVNLNFSRNKLQGPIPSYIGQMKDLRYLSFSRNDFTGAIPRELAQLTSLEVLELSSNSLSGEIPPDFSKLEHLHILLLDHNHLSGADTLQFW